MINPEELLARRCAHGQYPGEAVGLSCRSGHASHPERLPCLEYIVERYYKLGRVVI
jgi:hypothetical protein